jgi:prepilin-type N-terminal cleavage/methylation domain-containing protein
VRTFKTQSGFTLLEVLLVVGLIGVLGAISVPLIEKTIDGFRLNGDARNVANLMAVAKIRAASKFTRVRLVATPDDRTFHIETLDRSVTPPHWEIESGASYLSTGVTFGFGDIVTPPPSTQALIQQAPMCKADDNVTDIANTSCVVFNSRGTPVDATGAPIGNGVLYITDTTAIYGVAVAATGMIRLWRTFPSGTPTWVVQ